MTTVTTLKQMDPQAMQQLIIEYWYRTMMNDTSKSIADITMIIIAFGKLEKLKFNAKWMSPDSFTLKHDDTMALKCVKGNRWIMPDIEPVKKGKVCWRVKMINPKKGWFFWGISPKKVFDTIWTYDDGSIRGICPNKGFRPRQNFRHNNSDLDPQKFGNCEIDIFLDLDSNELRMCVVGKYENIKYANEAIWYDIEENDGWVPHFNFTYYSQLDQSIQIYRIPLQWYGKEAIIDWND